MKTTRTFKAVASQQTAERAAAEMWAADAASRDLGIELDEVSPGRARVRMTITARMLNGQHIGHGGYVFLLADTAFAYACNSYGLSTVARQCEISFLRPAEEGDELIATAVERARAGRSGIYDVSVTRADGQVVAELRGHSATVNPRWATPTS
jgi:acyl-CoA thioesterase